MINGKILVVDDEPDIRSIVKEILEDEGFTVDIAEDAEQARHLRKTFSPDLVLLDIWMPGTDGISLLKEWKETKALDIPVIMMSGHGNVETAVEATKVGAYDFIEKPLSLAKLILTVNHALENISLQQENERLRTQSRYVDLPSGKSRVMQQLHEQIARIANHNTPVLIIGESGSEKEIFARVLHRQGNLSDAPFISVSVSALSPDNAISTLYGSEEHGIIRKGLIEMADGGTLFLKDIADMDLTLQARLQNTIENQLFTRVGGAETHSINVRFIAATSQNLEELVQAGKFRDDLYYQLNVLPLKIPPLREHHEDIPELLDFFIEYFVQQQGLPRRQFNVAAHNYLRNYTWTGNIRELKNLVQRLLILGTGKNIDIDEIEIALGKQQNQTHDKEFNANFELPLRQAREQFEKAYLQYKLERANGSVSRVASDIGMERTHLYRKLKSLGIEIKPD
ncbi:MAG: transcriptional regulator [Gammaproteobacteria bacterium RIFCSPLOWO2_02_FULL_47_50]|jgi:DNA-binding NtrC family response regulator|nr:MAG: transcriptional regulator [Gammaproteobacteria bacterium RIFCSPLOWO2_02_47_7]OGT66451.1 MAG: transcriptional regulator [Gammaproteobacteria bacterium RIFCSPLOWO2_01_FULL_47_190]OGT75815.1 MAG: transcriptional regulator [Gammaproteobacteria bacterium RIFCSPLOWO2_12_47_11]OGT80251.1 MAG: transcriptional regulator [Gammaproteobacteria bacterium RIFCSPLOWO2_02_FULL_47_50]OGT87885.1 MAG: transcriptional regulator [Gammaproteobacteria bacterium RIFCSPLOWO2_12_FULL_47_76]